MGVTKFDMGWRMLAWVAGTRCNLPSSQWSASPATIESCSLTMLKQTAASLGWMQQVCFCSKSTWGWDAAAKAEVCHQESRDVSESGPANTTWAIVVFDPDSEVEREHLQYS